MDFSPCRKTDAERPRGSRDHAPLAAGHHYLSSKGARRQEVEPSCLACGPIVAPRHLYWFTKLLRCAENSRSFARRRRTVMLHTACPHGRQDLTRRTGMTGPGRRTYSSTRSHMRRAAHCR